jgi:hypothetical protein
VHFFAFFSSEVIALKSTTCKAALAYKNTSRPHFLPIEFIGIFQITHHSIATRYADQVSYS